MTDKELLERAAKAAGIEIEFDLAGQCIGLYKGENPWGLKGFVWNPLEDMGDALKLAVAKSMHVAIGDVGHPDSASDASMPNGVHSTIPHNGNPDKATCRAIVTAAALSIQ